MTDKQLADFLVSAYKNSMAVVCAIGFTGLVFVTLFGLVVKFCI